MAYIILGNIDENQIEQFDSKLIVGKRSTAFADFAQAHIDRFNRVGGINDALPIIAPRQGDRRISIVSFIFKV